MATAPSRPDTPSPDLPLADLSLPGLVDSFGRTIRYLRISVTDRCDLRCRYCMAEKMTFLPRSALLALEEIAAADASREVLVLENVA